MPKVLNVGQCGFDHASITRQLVKSFGAEVKGVSTFNTAVKALRSDRFDLVLVNRVTDSDGSSGLDLLRSLKADPDLSRLPVMLVSNYPEAQQEAESIGALPGFGKAEIHSVKAQERLRAAFSNSIAETPKA